MSQQEVHKYAMKKKKNPVYSKTSPNSLKNWIVMVIMSTSRLEAESRSWEFEYDEKCKVSF